MKVITKLRKSGQIDMMVRYWNLEKHMVDMRYLNSEFMGKVKEDILCKLLWQLGK